MLFIVKDRGSSLLPTVFPQAYLISDSWDDFGFRTYFRLVLFSEKGKKYELGGVKIGQFGLANKAHSPLLPAEFDELDSSFFSLGQSDKYYELLNTVKPVLKMQILKALRDVVSDLQLFDKVLAEEVTKTSLLRFVSTLTVRGQFRRLVEGGERLSRYAFSYQLPRSGMNRSYSVKLVFEVEPESFPPTNIHVLIGRNGVGKTYILYNMTRSLVEKGAPVEDVGAFISGDSTPTANETKLFANLVSVTFSAFDDFAPLPEMRDVTVGLKYSYVGLKRHDDQGDSNEMSPKSPKLLGAEFVNSLSACLQGYKRQRWQRSMATLETDPVFKNADILALVTEPELAESLDEEEYKREARRRFQSLSSGHKIVLLTMTRLVETVEERTMVLIDEPEAHLHPPLLSAFIRALSDLLIDQNGIAIIATHSPVVLQEVPSRCVWKLRRSGSQTVAERPSIETFGENVGVLTREVFGLEVTQSGFHKMLQSAVDRTQDYEEALEQFNDELGAEARAILRSLIAAKDLGEGF